MTNKLLFIGASLWICGVLALLGSAAYDGLDPVVQPVCAQAMERLPPNFSEEAQIAWSRMRPYARECR